jgi:hypothetical protein
MSRSARVGADAKRVNAIVNFSAHFSRRDLRLRADRDRQIRRDRLGKYRRIRHALSRPFSNDEFDMNAAFNGR